MKHFKQRGDVEVAFGVVMFFAVVIVMLFWNAYVAYGTESVVRGAKVEKSERVCDGGKDGSCSYLVFTDKGVLQNSDTILRGKFNSSDVYAAIKVGKSYDFTTVGFRVPLFSMYPNILHATPKAEPSTPDSAAIPQ